MYYEILNLNLSLCKYFENCMLKYIQLDSKSYILVLIWIVKNKVYWLWSDVESVKGNDEKRLGVVEV